MSQTSQTTTDHDEIKRWVDERGGHPARVKGTNKGKTAGVLRIDYPGYSGKDSLEEISWEEFFDGFEKNELAFLYQDETKDGELRRFSKMVDRNATEH
ncbi:MAG TPA: hypothetical protein VJS17_03885 [Pyrinomonadaceae bacterium]|nr:hypothetical protein [Pyrinomonadaceae bacterium]